MSGLTPLAHRIDAVIDRAVDDGRIVGTVVLVTQNGERAYARAAGHADLEAGSSTSIDTLFRLASLTKPMAAAAALALVERGRLALDDSVTTFLPDFRRRLVDGMAPEIQVRHLLTHTAGFGYPTCWRETAIGRPTCRRDSISRA
jgi:CubicO group peptidase (beta-lactamase class C family)